MRDGSESMGFTGERFVPDAVHGDIELEHLHRYLFACKAVSGKVVLDIASGEGYGSAMLARTAKKVTGVDISQEAILHAQSKYKVENLDFLIGSCSAIPLGDASVDVVVSYETLEHHDEHEAMMLEIKRVLRPTGVLIISSPDKLEYSEKPRRTNPHHVKELHRNEFKKLLEMYFNNHSLYGQRVVYGSAIFCEDNRSQIESYELIDDGLLAISGVPRALYLVAVASDIALPLLSSGILEQRIEDTVFITERDIEINWLKEKLLEKDAALLEKDSFYQKQAIEKDQGINWLNNKILERGEAISWLQQKFTEKDEALRERNSFYQKQIIEKDEGIKWLQDQIQNRDDVILTLNEKRLEIERDYTNQIAEKNNDIDWLKNQVNERGRDIQWLQNIFFEPKKNNNSIIVKLAKNLRNTINQSKIIHVIKIDVVYRLAKIYRRIEQKTISKFNNKSLTVMTERRKEVLFSQAHIDWVTHKNNQNDWPLIDICVVTYNSTEWLDMFMSSLVKQRYPLTKINLIFVDHSPNDETVKKINSICSDLQNSFFKTQVLQQANKGFGCGHNLAIKQGNADFILVTNID
ncbi:MAG: methyltransferase domain-containing protein, partial [Methylococcaceae bacterium]|nr:methyltransferase domain-containing protein [Methylococcaceae bacterium]